MDITNGYLTLILGPMFSGKSTKLIQYINKYKTLNKKMLIIKPSIDNRYTTTANICTHDMQTQNCICIGHYELNSIFNLDTYTESNIIIIEEGQFFDNLFENINKMLTDKKTIYISALNGDSNRELFGEIYKLIPICDNFEFLQALCLDCSDGTPAIFSKRLNTNNLNKILVAGATEYKAVCRHHYLN
jgi:thymidine kinase